MEEWEYDIIKIVSGTDTKTERQALNGMGASGWELVSTIFVSNGSSTWHYFKRRKRAESQGGAYR